VEATHIILILIIQAQGLVSQGPRHAHRYEQERVVDGEPAMTGVHVTLGSIWCSFDARTNLWKLRQTQFVVGFMSEKVSRWQVAFNNHVQQQSPKPA
jgi:hypothetical protein